MIIDNFWQIKIYFKPPILLIVDKISKNSIIVFFEGNAVVLTFTNILYRIKKFL